MFRSMLPARSALRTARPQAVVPSPIVPAPSLSLFGRRGYASEAEEHDLVIIGGGVAGYVAAIKAGQEGLKVRFPSDSLEACGRLS
jgi:dihydrolipoamide dehydrogenase